jgi:hypothetical protein
LEVLTHAIQLGPAALFVNALLTASGGSGIEHTPFARSIRY